MKTYELTSLHNNIVKLHGYPKDADQTVTGNASIRYSISREGGIQWQSEIVGYTATSFEYKDGKFDWKIDDWKTVISN